jgi:RNA polymerase sigma factor (sigma-70 family)
LNQATRTRRAEPSGPDDEPDLVRYYMQEIGATPLLTANEEVDLAKRIEAGLYAARLLEESAEDPDADPDPAPGSVEARPRAELEALVRDGEVAKDHMIRANLRLVVSAAKRYSRRELPFLDLIQEGNLGMMRAVEKFDYTKGYKFSTYAMWWIRQAIERGLAETSRTVRLPVHVVENLAKFGRIERQLRARLDRDPTPEEIAAEAGMPVRKVTELRRLAQQTVSLEAPLGDETESRIGDLIEDADTVNAADIVEFQQFAAELRSLVDTLPPRDALILTLRYGLHDGRQHSLQEIAERLGLTRERIRQLEKIALAQLRDPRYKRHLVAWAG